MNKIDRFRNMKESSIDEYRPRLIVENERENPPKIGEQVALYSEADGSTNELKIGGTSVNLER